jgi:hypothetical protein
VLGAIPQSHPSSITKSNYLTDKRHVFPTNSKKGRIRVEDTRSFASKVSCILEENKQISGIKITDNILINGLCNT